jgi:hypothetical protein
VHLSTPVGLLAPSRAPSSSRLEGPGRKEVKTSSSSDHGSKISQPLSLPHAPSTLPYSLSSSQLLDAVNGFLVLLDFN